LVAVLWNPMLGGPTRKTDFALQHELHARRTGREAGRWHALEPDVQEPGDRFAASRGPPGAPPLLIRAAARNSDVRACSEFWGNGDRDLLWRFLRRRVGSLPPVP